MLSATINALAQPRPTINSMPANPSGLFPGYYSMANVTLPRLSIVGFDNTQPFGSHTPVPGHGLGLRQLIEGIYGSATPPLDPDDAVRETYLQILVRARRSIAGENEKTLSTIYMSRALEALVTYILSKNGVAEDEMRPVGAPLNPANGGELDYSHQEALDRLEEMNNTDSIPEYCDAIVNLNDLCVGYKPDPVQATFAIIATAQGVDLSAALVYAYNSYGDPPPPILPWENYFGLAEVARDFWKISRSTIADKQPGNWSLKITVAAAFALAALSADDPNDTDGDNTYFGAQERFDLYQKAIDAVAISPGASGQWHYQTDGGHSYWAEGAYYFNFSLVTVVPFLHAMRAGGFGQGATLPHFHSSGFLSPIEWLADTSEPGGFTTPLDDGNKFSLHSAPMLRWAPEYVDNDLQGIRVGQKFAAINENLQRAYGVIERFGGTATLMLTEDAIPRTTCLLYTSDAADDMQCVDPGGHRSPHTKMT